MTSNLSQNPVPKGDDTSSFGRKFITINVSNPYLYPISRLVVVTNGGRCIKNKTFEDENQFQVESIELVVNYESPETALFNNVNVVNVVAYDNQNKQYTCPESLIFYAKNGVITGYGK